MPAWDKQRYRVRNTSRDAVLATGSGRASNVVGRGFGLMLHKNLPAGSGLIIEPCKSIVSFFMRFPFDALFVGKDGKVVHTVENMKRWRSTAIIRNSAYVIELPAGTLEATHTAIGDHIEYAPV